MSEEQKEKVWDVVRASFWLLASIIWAQILFGYLTLAICFYGQYSGITAPGACKEFVPNIMELLVGGMAVVIAFSGRAK